MKALVLLTLVLALPANALAGEVWFGGYDHDVKTPLTYSGFEPGADVELGWRGERLEAWRWAGRPSPYLFVSGNTEDATNFAAAGVSWRFGDRVFFRPGIGLAVHDGPDHFDPASDRIWFGSRVLFEPEVALGWQASERLALEASWVHLSHAQLADRQNPGMDSFGVRLTFKTR
jgi:lipid A 3-O-deacylase